MDKVWSLGPADGERRVASADGRLTDSTDYAEVLRAAEAGPLVLDLGGVRQISSVGVREWLHFVQALGRTGHSHRAVKLAPTLVRQMNMIADFCGPLAVDSVLLPYYCDACGHEQHTELEIAKRATGDEVASHQTCEACGAQAEFDDLPASYLRSFDNASE